MMRHRSSVVSVVAACLACLPGLAAGDDSAPATSSALALGSRVVVGLPTISGASRYQCTIVQGRHTWSNSSTPRTTPECILEPGAQKRAGFSAGSAHVRAKARVKGKWTSIDPMEITFSGAPAASGAPSSGGAGRKWDAEYTYLKDYGGVADPGWVLLCPSQGGYREVVGGAEKGGNMTRMSVADGKLTFTLKWLDTEDKDPDRNVLHDGGTYTVTLKPDGKDAKIDEDIVTPPFTATDASGTPYQTTTAHVSGTLTRVTDAAYTGVGRSGELHVRFGHASDAGNGCGMQFQEASFSGPDLSQRSFCSSSGASCSSDAQCCSKVCVPGGSRTGLSAACQ